MYRNSGCVSKAGAGLIVWYCCKERELDIDVLSRGIDLGSPAEKRYCGRDFQLCVATEKGQ